MSADRVAALEAALSTAIGNMMNAKFDLECGTTKAFAVQQIGKAIDRAMAVLTPPHPTGLTPKPKEMNDGNAIGVAR